MEIDERVEYLSGYNLVPFTRRKAITS